MRSWHHGNIMTAPSAVRGFIERSKELIVDPIIGIENETKTEPENLDRWWIKKAGMIFLYV